ncbi:MAG: M56 family metallopeptidase, partial [Candidatus Latescibacter sp.]|nr:M56 family metallopeptidase [Candidatus Latescibacter sp.]
MIPFDAMFAAVGHTLWAVSWQVCILAAIALIAERFIRNAPPSFRYLLWLLVIIRLAVPFDIPLPAPAGDFVNLHIPLDFSPVDTGAVQPSLNIPNQAAAPFDPFPIAGLLWLIGFVSFVLYLATRFIKTRRLFSITEPVTRSDLCDLLNKYASDLGIRKKIGLFASRDESFHAPAVIGVIQPRIILPHEIVSAWTVQDIEPVLLHEMIHIRNRDLLVNWFQIILNGIYFFHPVIWLANSRIRKAREEICDDSSVARLHTERERYSLSMIRIGEEFLQERKLTFAEVSFTENGSSLGERIRRIMSGSYIPHRRLTALSLAALCAIAVFGVML